MPNSNNIKDALIKNNEMIANELRTNFAKKSEVSELATDKVDKRTFADNNEVAGEINNANGKISIKSNSMEANQASYTEIKLSTNCGDGIDAGHTNNELIIGASGAHSQYDKYGIVAQSYRMPSGNQEDSIYNIVNIDADDIEIIHKEGVVTSTYNLLNSLDTVDNVADHIDALYENGIGAFNFDKVFSGDDNIIPTKTITFGTNGNYKSLLDLSKFVFSADGSGTNYDYNDENTTRTRFSNRTQNNPLRIPVKRGGVLTISSGSSASINATITINNSSTTVTSLPYSTAAANYDQYITILFTSTITNNKFVQMTITNFVNVYVTENKLKANYYNKSEVDAAISGIGGVSLSGYNIFTGHNTFTNGYFDVTYPKVTDEDYHEIYAVTNSEDDANRIMLEVGTEGINNNIAQFELSNDDHDLYTAWTLDGSRRTGGTSDIGMYMSESRGALSDAMFKLWTNPRHISDIFSTTMTADDTGFEIAGYIDDGVIYNNSLAINHEFDVTISAREDGDTDSSNINLSSNAFTITVGANKFKVSDSGVPQFSSDGGITWRDISLVNP